MNKDSRQIFEAYKTNPQVLNEGILDRMKARGAQAVGTVAGAGKRVAGTAKGALAGAKGDITGVEAATQQRATGAIQGQLSKIESYRKTATDKINKLSNEIFGDLLKLGIDIKQISPQTQNALPQALNKALDEVTAQIRTQAGIKPPAAGASTQSPAVAQTATNPSQTTQSNQQSGQSQAQSVY